MMWPTGGGGEEIGGASGPRTDPPADAVIQRVAERLPFVARALYEAAKRDVEADPAAFIGPLLADLKPHQLATVNWIIVEARRVGHAASTAGPEATASPSPTPMKECGDGCQGCEGCTPTDRSTRPEIARTSQAASALDAPQADAAIQRAVEAERWRIAKVLCEECNGGNEDYKAAPELSYGRVIHPHVDPEALLHRDCGAAFLTRGLIQGALRRAGQRAASPEPSPGTATPSNELEQARAALAEAREEGAALRAERDALREAIIPAIACLEALHCSEPMEIAPRMSAVVVSPSVQGEIARAVTLIRGVFGKASAEGAAASRGAHETPHETAIPAPPPEPTA